MEANLFYVMQRKLKKEIPGGISFFNFFMAPFAIFKAILNRRPQHKVRPFKSFPGILNRPIHNIYSRTFSPG